MRAASIRALFLVYSGLSRKKQKKGEQSLACQVPPAAMPGVKKRRPARKDLAAAPTAAPAAAPPPAPALALPMAACVSTASSAAASPLLSWEQRWALHETPPAEEEDNKEERLLLLLQWATMECWDHAGSE